jgi:wobble nucleotide-excising tRNase
MRQFSSMRPRALSKVERLIRDHKLRGWRSNAQQAADAEAKALEARNAQQAADRAEQDRFRKVVAAGVAGAEAWHRELLEQGVKDWVARGLEKQRQREAGKGCGG